MKLSQLKVVKEQDVIFVSWKVDNREGWLEYQNCQSLPCIADGVLVSCLISAMKDAEDIYLDESFLVSHQLLINLKTFQSIYTAWFPDHSAIEIIADNISYEPMEDTHNRKPQVACFYSGGVDASYTFFKEKEAITHLFFCHGLDIQLNEKKRFETSLEHAQHFAAQYGKELVLVKTNLRHLFPAYSSHHSQVIILIGYALSCGFKQLLVPASHSKTNLTPFGTHPLTDPLLSNGVTEVIHHGMEERTHKTFYIAEFDAALSVLRVCNASDEHNCGKCEKCLRTMATLAIIDKISPHLPVLLSPKTLNLVKIYKEKDLVWWHDISEEAFKAGKDDIGYAARRVYKSLERRLLIKRLLREFKSI